MIQAFTKIQNLVINKSDINNFIHSYYDIVELVFKLKLSDIRKHKNT